MARLCYWLLALGCFFVAPPAALAADLASFCVRQHLAQIQTQGKTLGIAASDATQIVTEVADSIGLKRPVTIVPCDSTDKAAAWVGTRENGPEGEFIIYNPDWVREVVGRDRVHAAALFGHELAHFLNGDFTAARQALPRTEIESDADRFAGCAVARMSGDFKKLEDLLSRLRREQDRVYPDRLTSIESARKGFEACKSAEPAAKGGKSHAFQSPILDVRYSRRVVGAPEFWVGQAEDGQIKIVDSTSDRTLRTTQCPGPVGEGVAVHRGSRFVAVRCDWKIHVISLGGESEDYRLDPIVADAAAGTFNAGPGRLVWALNAFASSGIGRCVYIWDLRKKSVLQKLQCDTTIEAIALDDFGARLLTATERGGIVSMWAGMSNEAKLQWQVALANSSAATPKDGYAITKLAFGPGRYAIAVTSSSSAFLIDTANGATTAVSHHQSAKLLDGVLDKAGQMFATAGTDGKVHVWSTRDGSKLWTFEHEDRVNRIEFTTDNRFLVSTGRDRTTRVWSLETGRETAKLDHPVSPGALDVRQGGDGAEYVLVGTGQRFSKEAGIFHIQEWRLTTTGKLVPRTGS